ncbi:MAG: bifunctional 4-hydroxy-2-oxoglutarate aldolase/2-dehydro-3-deoxy-phosphogluconate aldolase [Oscillospiraceae bacterium]|nr:bifunctional 4-hydroxy-2-oxoglutarate aldolase/2-dehydro-3-deoxy-phosphogluconate aldolase [Oscillospiraceae bacterium]
MTALERFQRAGIVPVVVLESADNAVPCAEAMLKGGIDAMEITFRTAAAADAIKAVADNCPDMLVGAGTVLNLDQAKLAVKMGAKFIVAPGYDEETVTWCCENDIPVCPGCVTPTEIMLALKHGLKVVKFFPANVYGGLKALKSLSAPFVGLKFMPTGGVAQDNVGEFIAAPFIHAVGGSWICPKADIDAGNWDKITKLCLDARAAALGFELAHIGINEPDRDASVEVAEKFNAAFDFGVKEGNSSTFSGPIEVMKTNYLGKNGHIAVRTNSIPMAMMELEKRGFVVDMDTAKYKGTRLNAIYLKDEFGGFAVHLLQK